MTGSSFQPMTDLAAAALQRLYLWV